MRRSITGLDVSSLDLEGGAEWWWSMPIGPNAAWATTSAAFALLAVLLAWRAAQVPEPMTANRRR
jgi:hypothetical protein